MNKYNFEKTKKNKKNKLNRILLIVMVAVVVYSIHSILIQQIKIANLNRARREKIQIISNLEKEINEYKKDLDERETHEFIEKIARKNYGMVKDEDFKDMNTQKENWNLDFKIIIIT